MSSSSVSDLMSKLVEVNKVRDHLMAQLADIEFNRALSRQYTLTTPEQRKQYQDNLDRIERREQRRAFEIKNWGYYQRPGPWDSDLDTYQNSKTVESVGDNIRILIVRSDRFSWNGYVLLPKTHPVYISDTPYDQLEDAPVEVSYGGQSRYSTSGVRGKYGFYNSGSDPYAMMVGQDSFFYTSFSETRGKCLLLAEYFKTVTTCYPSLPVDEMNKFGRDLCMAIVKRLMETDTKIPTFDEFVEDVVGKSTDYRVCGGKFWKLLTPSMREEWDYSSLNPWKLLIRQLTSLKESKWSV